MKQVTRIPFTEREKSDLWKLWKSGESLSEIGRLFERHAATVYGVILKNGGCYPYQSKHSSLHLCLTEREEISRGLASGLSIREIAKRIDRSPSTVSREIKRNKGASFYRATDAENEAIKRSKRPKQCKLKKNAKLRKK